VGGTGLEPVTPSLSMAPALRPPIVTDGNYLQSREFDKRRCAASRRLWSPLLSSLFPRQTRVKVATFQ